jgi:ribonuclease Z
MKRFFVTTAVVGGIWITAVAPPAEAAPCLLITLTGTQSGPATFNGQAGAGTLISFGDDSNDCGTVKLLVDAGRV